VHFFLLKKHVTAGGSKNLKKLLLIKNRCKDKKKSLIVDGLDA
jgi:hypothetical protein